MKSETRNSKFKIQTSVLILGYGNPDRRDDRVGWYILEKLQSLVPDTVRLETLHQLEIEWAETVKDYDLVIFVDCHISDKDDWKRVMDIEPGYEVSTVSHQLTPADLLGLCSVLYHQVPKGILYSVKGTNFNFGTELSKKTCKVADEVVEEIAKTIISMKHETLNLR